MGFLDKLTKKAPELRERAARIAATQNEKIDQGIEKAAGAANKATKGKHAAAIDSAADKARNAAEKLAENDKKP